VTPLEYFRDPILRAPTIACMLMCLSASLIGVIGFLRKQSLLGEALSHASFPGVIIGVVLSGWLFQGSIAGLWLPALTMGAGFLSALLGLMLVHYLEAKLMIPTDSALCFVLSSFFGIGLTMASRVQFTHATLYVQSLSYLFGQAATMVDIHILLYGILSLGIIAAVILFYKELQALIFDCEYAKSIGIRVSFIRGIIFMLIALAVVVGIRSVGVVLMSAMLIAPPVAARQFTHRLSIILVLAGCFGLLSGYFGIYLSVEMTNYFAALYPTARVAFPSGPMIVLVATSFCLLSLLFAPERGLFARLYRRMLFRYHCTCENILKAMWRLGPNNEFRLSRIGHSQSIGTFYLLFILSRLKRQGWVKQLPARHYKLTTDGVQRAAHIVRLHRLWELYLADYLGMGIEKVHRSAEEMEHIITPEIEEQLTEMLNNPKFDPHRQPIPPHEEKKEK